MNNLVSLTAEFERQKNTRALLYTAGLAGALLFMIVFVKWTIPQKTLPVTDEFIEINLGNSNVGSGTDQPLLPGDAAPQKDNSYTPSPQAPTSSEMVKDISNENETSREAPAVIKPVINKVNATKINSENKVVKTNKAAVVPAPPTPVPPRPKAQMNGVRGGTGAGNGADTYKPGTGEGTAGGRGDQGVEGGNPNGKNYAGIPRNLGVRIINIPAQNFEDDFNESGKIALDIVVDGSGRLQSASYQISGSTLPRSSKQYDIALRRAKEIKYPQYEGGFKQKLTLNFSVK